MSKKYGKVMGIAVLVVGLLTGSVNAQLVGTAISDSGSLPNTNAMLDIQSPATGAGKGLLIPRITSLQRTNASVAEAGGLLDDSGDLRGGTAQGLTVYQTDSPQGFYYNTSTNATPSWAYVGDNTGAFKADGSVSMSGDLDMGGQGLTNVASIGFNSDFVAVGKEANGINQGTAVGYQANGSQKNIAIGYQANAGGVGNINRIAIGNEVVNGINYTVALRGELYLDGGGSTIYHRPMFGMGTWQTKTFTIDHPLDPENKVLRHYCMEGPDVWNVYAGNAQLLNGKAIVELPDYYTALNAVGSEVYSLTVVDESANQFPLVKIAQKVSDNAFVIAGTLDVEVSWTIKVLRNDPGCLEDLKRRPVEQLKSELPAGQIQAENQSVNTFNITQ